MSNTDRDSMLERWADGMEKLEQYYEGIYGPPATPPSLPPITTRDAMLEAIADGMERAKRNINKKSTTYHSDSVAYVKTVPAGDVHYASLEQVGGKTLVWNQLLNAGTISVATTDTAEKTVDSFSGVSSHKYLIMWYQDTTLTSNTRNTMLVRDSNYVAVYEGSGTNHNLSAGQYSWLLNTSTLTSGTWTVNYWCHSPSNNVNIENIMLIDLTLMYGAGNEPTTVEEFTAQFPAQYYAFNNGTLLSAGVTEVVSNGKNTWNMMNPWFYGKDFYNQSVGHQFSGNSPTARPTDNGDGTFSFTPSANWYGFIYLLDVSISNEDVRVKVTFRGTGLRSSFYRLDKNFKVLYMSNGSTSGGVNSWDVLSNKDTYPNVQYIAFGVGTTTGGSTITVEYPQCEVSDTATDYSPYHAPIQYPIPAEIQALEGYGWSAGSVYNYVDFERKVFVKNVGSVDLGTLTWSQTTMGGNTVYVTNSVTDIKPVDVNTVAFNGISPLYKTVSRATLNSTAIERLIAVNTVGQVITCPIDSYADANAFKSAMSGVYLYYELATPQEIDISAYLTDDNLIEVEAGGTLTFPNQNGDDYRIDVPSSVTFVVGEP